MKILLKGAAVVSIMLVLLSILAIPQNIIEGIPVILLVIICFAAGAGGFWIIGILLEKDRDKNSTTNSSTT